MKAIADTGFLVAYLSERDRFYSWAVGLARQSTEPFLTCEAVLAETAYHLRDSAVTLALVESGLVRIAFDAGREIARLSQLATRYADREPDLADLCIIRMSELHPKYSVLSVDVSDFRVYRRNQREVIPLIHPPGL